ncbi:MAG TPA: hypothetical protein VOA00_12125 [Thermoanaerobaculia bacterium]|nr:hypothetical protein [Thermoanaerobaculia bacterium]
MSQNQHPSRSPEFLSRLHDGELSPGERAHFESHRAHCAECRNAAAEFEAALSLYRSSRPAPASADLSARILRKLQASGRRRPFFGATFGIDLRWAGAFAAALIAAIIGSAIVAKNEARENLAARSVPIPVVVRESAPPAKASGPGPAAAAPASAGEMPSSAAARAGRADGPSAAPEIRSAFAREPEAARRNRAEEKASSLASASKDKRTDALSGTGRVKDETGVSAPPSEVAGAPLAAAPVQRSLSAPGRAAAAPERAGGEGDAGAPPEATPFALRLVTLSLDGSSSPPDILSPSAAGVPSNLRGRSFVLIVDAGGRVRQVRPHGGAGAAGAISAQDSDAPAPPSLLALRFRPGDRQRRLLLRVE